MDSKIPKWSFLKANMLTLFFTLAPFSSLPCPFLGHCISQLKEASGAFSRAAPDIWVGRQRSCCHFSIKSHQNREIASRILSPVLFSGVSLILLCIYPTEKNFEDQKTWKSFANVSQEHKDCALKIPYCKQIFISVGKSWMSDLEVTLRQSKESKNLRFNVIAP